MTSSEHRLLSIEFEVIAFSNQKKIKPPISKEPKDKEFSKYLEGSRPTSLTGRITISLETRENSPRIKTTLEGFRANSPGTFYDNLEQHGNFTGALDISSATALDLELERGAENKTISLRKKDVPLKIASEFEDPGDRTNQHTSEDTCSSKRQDIFGALEIEIESEQALPLHPATTRVKSGYLIITYRNHSGNIRPETIVANLRGSLAHFSGRGPLAQLLVDAPKIINFRIFGFGDYQDKRKSTPDLDNISLQTITAKSVWKKYSIQLQFNPQKRLPARAFIEPTDATLISQITAGTRMPGMVDIFVVDSRLDCGYFMNLNNHKLGGGAVFRPNSLLATIILSGRSSKNPFLLAHEIGHVLGGAHPPTDGAATPPIGFAWRGAKGGIMEPSESVDKPNPHKYSKSDHRNAMAFFFPSLRPKKAH